MSTLPESPTPPKSQDHESFDFRGINYEGIRNEFVNIFSSFRTLVIAQITALAFVGKEIFTATSFEWSLGVNFVFVLVVILPTIIGHNWLAQAIYQVSYIFVTYELPALGRLVKNSDNDTVESRNGLWVLSNRVKSKVHRPHLASQSNVYLGGTDARNFHILQVIFSVLLLVFAFFFSKSSVFNLIDLLYPDKALHNTTNIFRVIGWLINLKLMITAVVLSAYYLRITKTIIIDATNHWMAYFNDRDNQDREYLKQFDKEFMKKVGLGKYVWGSTSEE